MAKAVAQDTSQAVGLNENTLQDSSEISSIVYTF